VTGPRVQLPGGATVQVSDISPRQLVVPVGTTLQVPAEHEWYVTSMAVLPTRGYVPPLGAGEERDARAWGDLQISVNGAPGTYRMNVLTLIDRYWGRYNLNPLLPEVTARLTAAQQAAYTAPKLTELHVHLDHLVMTHGQYLDAAAPRFDAPLILKDGAKFTIEHVPSETGAVIEVLVDADHGPQQVNVLRALDVELIMLVKRPIS